MNIANIFEIANSSPVTCYCKKVDLGITVRSFSSKQDLCKGNTRGNNGRMGDTINQN